MTKGRQEQGQVRAIRSVKKFMPVGIGRTATGVMTVVMTSPIHRSLRKNDAPRMPGGETRLAQPAKPSCRLAGALRSRATLWLAELQAPAKAAAESAEEKRKQEQNDEDEKHDLRDSRSRPGDSAKSKHSCNQRYNKQRYDQAEHDAVLRSVLASTPRARASSSRRGPLGPREFRRTLQPAAFPMTSSNLVGIVFRWESEESRHHNKDERRIKLRFRLVNRSCELAAEAIELDEKGKQLAHRGAASWDGSAASWVDQRSQIVALQHGSGSQKLIERIKQRDV